MPLTDRQKQLLAKRDLERANRHEFDMDTRRGKNDFCGICGKPKDHPYHAV